MDPILRQKVTERWEGIEGISMFPNIAHSAENTAKLLATEALLPSAVKKILEIPEDREVAVLGTIYKEMKLKPSILAEYTEVRCLPFVEIYLPPHYMQLHRA